MKESQLEKSVLDFLSYLGISARKMFAFRSSYPSKAGIEVSSHPVSRDSIPYIIGSVDGLIVAIRLSKEKPKEDPFLERVKTRNGIAFVAGSVSDVALELAKYWPEEQINRYLQ